MDSCRPVEFRLPVFSFNYFRKDAFVPKLSAKWSFLAMRLLIRIRMGRADILVDEALNLSLPQTTDQHVTTSQHRHVTPSFGLTPNRTAAFPFQNHFCRDRTALVRIIARSQRSNLRHKLGSLTRSHSVKNCRIGLNFRVL